jgi:hypothetical protein
VSCRSSDARHALPTAFSTRETLPVDFGSAGLSAAFFIRNPDLASIHFGWTRCCAPADPLIHKNLADL